MCVNKDMSEPAGDDCPTCIYNQRQANYTENYSKELQKLMQGQQDVMAKQAEKIDKCGRRIERLLLKINKLRREKEGATKPFVPKILTKKKFFSEGKSSLPREEKDTFGYFKEVQKQFNDEKADLALKRKASQAKAADLKSQFDAVREPYHEFMKSRVFNQFGIPKKKTVFSRIKRALGFTKALKS